MILKEAVYETKEVTETKCVCVSEKIIGCDCCKKPFNPNDKNLDIILNISVFNNKIEGADHLVFCSWECVLNFLPKIKSDYFINLPYVHYDFEKESKGGIHELIRLLKRNTSVDKDDLKKSLALFLNDKTYSKKYNIPCDFPTESVVEIINKGIDVYFKQTENKKQHESFDDFKNVFRFIEDDGVSTELNEKELISEYANFKKWLKNKDVKKLKK